MKNLKTLWDKEPDMVDGIGGEQLAGSGFECEQVDEEFAATELIPEGEE